MVHARSENTIAIVLLATAGYDSAHQWHHQRDRVHGEWSDNLVHQDSTCI
jgi:hypothetical protein